MVLAVKVAVGAHLHPELGHIALGIGQQGIDRRQGGRRALVGGLVERVQDDADQQRLAGFLPVRFQTAAVRVDDQRGEVLHVANLVFGADPDFVQGVPADAAAGRSGLEAQHLVFRMLPAPAGGQGPELAFQVGDDGALAPRQEGRHHQADPLAGTGRRVAQDMLRTVVAQVMRMTPRVQPGTDIDAGARRRPGAGERLPERSRPGQQARRLDVLQVGPAGRTVQVRVQPGRVGQDHPANRQAEEAQGGDDHADTAGAHDRVWVLPVPLASPLQDRPRHIQVLEVTAQCRLVAEIVREELGGGLQAGRQGNHDQRRDELAGFRRRSSHLWSDGVVELVFHRLLPGILMEPLVTVTGSPRARRFIRRALASSIGSTMTSSPRFRRASEWPSI
ncbi:MAG: hypothetical protein AW10_03360 [Candidatus Accumulibacter appositus]|uniref:Uncharacterized protein n=1 Tax=Candidatus Accumulibacter appositus TaxID=1454003 RepID=A0A011PMD6_9PROT|nr:MAG: hypothetical protein AW10_03360 [Candidatus Accumulibacter appositus]